MSLFEQTDLGRLPLQGPLACFKIGLESIERGALDLVSILWRHRDWFWSLVWGESKSCACVWVLQGGGR